MFRRTLWCLSALLLVSLAAAHAAPARFSGGLCSAASQPGLAALAEQIFRSPFQGPTIVGEEVPLGVRNPAFESLGDEARIVWSWEIHEPEASYIAPHFSRFHLPPGAVLVVRSPRGERSWRFTGAGKGDLGLTEGFWGIHIPGPAAILELWSSVPVAEGAVVVDRFARGFPEAIPPEPEAICGTDDSQWAKCLETSAPAQYNKSRAVARLMIGGIGACTGWLIGDAGHLMTNEHCITSASDAANTDYELMAEGATCTTNCASYGGCPGTVVATSGTLIQLDVALDYALVKLPVNPSATYGFLQLRAGGAQVDEQIYIPGHPAAWGKRIASNSTHANDASGKCEVYSLNEVPCSGGTADVGYFCDTQGGSSGSPVVGSGDHLVVALHHCAYCPNLGVPIQAIISDLGSNLPPNAVGNPCTPPPAPYDVTAAAAGTSQIHLSWSAVPGASQYQVFRATVSGGPYTLASTSAATSFLDSGRSCNTAYHYVVRAVEGACISADSSQATATTTPCASCTPQTLYSNDFETGSGLADWAVGTLGGGTSTVDWRGIQACTARSGSQVFRFGGLACADDYVNNGFTFAQPGGSAGIAVPAGATGTQLSFWHRREFETGYDGGALTVSMNGTNYFFVPSTAILSGTNYNGITSTSCPPASGGSRQVFTGTDTSFTQTVVDLDAACNVAAGVSCAGQSVRVGFTSITDCVVFRDGWFLDDVAVTTCIPNLLPAGAADFYTLPPCRVIDTRQADGALGGPPLYPSAERAFAVAGACGIPATARALAVNLTVTSPAGAGYLQVYPGNSFLPETSVINFTAGETRANNAVVGLATDGTATLKARAETTGKLHLLVDVVGYFQ